MGQKWLLYLGVGAVALLGYSYISNSGNSSSASSGDTTGASGAFNYPYGIAPISSGTPGVVNAATGSDNSNPYSLDSYLQQQRDIQMNSQNLQTASQVSAGLFSLFNNFLNNNGLGEFSGTIDIPGYPVGFDVAKTFHDTGLNNPALSQGQIVSNGGTVPAATDTAPAASLFSGITDALTNAAQTIAAAFQSSPAPTSPDQLTIVPFGNLPETQAASIPGTASGAVATLPASAASQNAVAPTPDQTATLFPADTSAVPADYVPAIINNSVAAYYSPASSYADTPNFTPAPIDATQVANGNPLYNGTNPVGTIQEGNNYYFQFANGTQTDVTAVQPQNQPAPDPNRFRYGIDTSLYGSDPESQRQLLQDLQQAKLDWQANNGG